MEHAKLSSSGETVSLKFKVHKITLSVWSENGGTHKYKTWKDEEEKKKGGGRRVLCRLR